MAAIPSTTSGKPQLAELMILANVIGLGLVQPFTVLFAIIFRLDPFSSFFTDMTFLFGLKFSLFSWQNLTILLLRCTFLQFTIFDILRIISCTVATLSLVSISTTKSCKMLRKIGSLSDFLDYYRQFYFLGIFTQNTANIGIFSLMCLGFVVGVMFNYAAIALWDVIPLPFFLKFPAGAFLVAVTIHFTLPVGVAIYMDSAKLIGTRVIEVAYSEVISSHERKYFLKYMKALRPLMANAGLPGFTLFALKRETKCTFYSAYVDYTINALLSK